MSPFDIIRPEGRVKITLEVFEEGGETICGLRWMTGELRAGPKAVRRAIREELRKIERIAKASGVAEMRHAGDERAWFLCDYEPCPGLRNGRRKRL